MRQHGPQSDTCRDCQGQAEPARDNLQTRVLGTAMSSCPFGEPHSKTLSPVLKWGTLTFSENTLPRSLPGDFTRSATWGPRHCRTDFSAKAGWGHGPSWLQNLGAQGNHVANRTFI